MWKKIANSGMRTAVTCGLALVGLVAAVPTYAADTVPQCTLSEAAKSLIPSSLLQTARDAPIGTPLSTSFSGQIVLDCPSLAATSPYNDQPFQWTVTSSPLAKSTTVGDALETGTPGVGIKVTLNGNNVINLLDHPTNFPVGAPYPANSTRPSGSHTTINFILTLVKTGPIAPGAAGAQSQIVLLTTRNRIANVDSLYAMAIQAPAAAQIAPTCTVTQPSINVALPTISATALRSVNTVAGATLFNIGLNCSSGSSLYVTLTDANTPGNQSNLLSLLSDSSATGVSLQILKSDRTPVNFGADSAAPGNLGQWRLGAVPDGTMNIPLIVQYIATAATVKPGTVKAIATFTLSYQ